MLAHVTYVTPDAGPPLGLGDLIARLLERPGEIALLAIGAVAILGLLLADLRFRPGSALRSALVARADSYLGLTPWMLRLSLGLPLLGAGVLQYAFAPDVRMDGFPYLLLTVLGFCLLLGLASRLAAAGLVVIGTIAVILQPRLIEVIEMPAIALAIVLVGSGIPSVDDLLAAARAAATKARNLPAALGSGEPVAAEESLLGEQIAPRRDLLALIIRSGLGLSLLAAGLSEKLLDPGRATLAVEKYQLTSVVPVSEWLWIAGAGLTESALGAMILIGAWTRISALLAFGVLSLTLFALPDDPVLAHVTLFGSCSVLIVTGAGRWSVDAVLRGSRGLLRRRPRRTIETAPAAS